MEPPTAALPADGEVVNPLFDARRVQTTSHPTPGQPFYGEAACDAFADRLLQYIKKEEVPPSRPTSPKFKSLDLNRSLATNCTLPDRIQAKLLLQVAARYMGNGQFLYLKKSFVEELESVYSDEAEPSTLWLCKFFALLALGELYSPRRRWNNDEKIPGEDYFVAVVDMLKDLYDEATTLQVEIYLLLVGIYLLGPFYLPMYRDLVLWGPSLPLNADQGLLFKCSRPCSVGIHVFRHFHAACARVGDA